MQPVFHDPPSSALQALEFPFAAFALCDMLPMPLQFNLLP